jgi:hypothetical protein
MVPEPVGLLTIRLWVEAGSSEPLRANVRYTSDVSQGYQVAQTLSDERAVHQAVQRWLTEFAAGHPVAEPAKR